MIQRIQTIYLFLVFIFALLFIFFPKGIIETASLSYIVKSFAIEIAETGESYSYSNFLSLLVIILPFVIMIMSVYSTFQYKNRPLQIKLGKMNVFMHVLLVVSVFFYLDALKTHLQGTISYGIAIIFPLAAMLFLLLANRAIRKDEQLVRSADRLR